MLNSHWECQMNSDTFLFFVLHLLVQVILTLLLCPLYS